MPLRDDYVAAIEAENETLRARIIDLEREFGFHNEVPLMFGLTASEAKVVSLLLQRDIASKTQILTAIMADRGADDEPEIKIVDVYICKVRHKIKPFGVAIDTVWGRGYSLTTANKSKIREYLPIPQAAE